MTTERHERLSQVFLEASKLDGVDRDAFLDAACGDDGTLRAEVEAMLRHDVEDEQDAFAPGRERTPLPTRCPKVQAGLLPGAWWLDTRLLTDSAKGGSRRCTLPSRTSPCVGVLRSR